MVCDCDQTSRQDLGSRGTPASVKAVVWPQFCVSRQCQKFRPGIYTVNQERPKYPIYSGHTSVRSRTNARPRPRRPQDSSPSRDRQLSFASLLSSGCQSQRVRVPLFGLPVQQRLGCTTRGSSSRRQAHPAACVPRCGSPGLDFDSYADSGRPLRCTAGVNRRHLTLTFRCPLPCAARRGRCQQAMPDRRTSGH